MTTLLPVGTKLANCTNEPSSGDARIVRIQDSSVLRSRKRGLS